MVYKYLLVCCLLCSTALHSRAQTSKAFSLSQLWEKALQQYPSIKAHEASLRQTSINYRLAKHQYLPQIQLQAQHTIGVYQGMGGAFFPLPGIFNTSGTGDNAGTATTHLSGSAVLDWQFLQFGKHKTNVKAAHIQVEQAASALSLEQLEIQSAVTQGYIQLLYHQHMQQWAAGNVQRFSELLEVTQSLTTAGLRPGADSLLLKASLRQAHADRSSWRSEAAASTLALSQWTHLPAETLKVRQQAFFSSERLLAADRQLPEQHPALALEQQQKDYVQTQMELARRSIFPDVSLLAGALVRGSTLLNGEGSTDSWQEVYQHPADNYLVGIGLRWNLSGLYNQRLRNRQYQEQLNLQQAELSTVKREITRQQQTALKQLEQQRQQIEDAEAAYTAALQAYELFETRYRSGLISLTELLQIQQVLQQTEKTRIYAYHQYWLRAAELARSAVDFSFLAKVFS